MDSVCAAAHVAAAPGAPHGSSSAQFHARSEPRERRGREGGSRCGGRRALSERGSGSGRGRERTRPPTCPPCLAQRPPPLLGAGAVACGRRGDPAGGGRSARRRAAPARREKEEEEERERGAAESRRRSAAVGLIALRIKVFFRSLSLLFSLSLPPPPSLFLRFRPLLCLLHTTAQWRSAPPSCWR